MDASMRMTQRMQGQCWLRLKCSTKGKEYSLIIFLPKLMSISLRYEDRNYAEVLSRADFWQLAAIKAIEVGLVNANSDVDCGEEVCQGLVR